MPEVYLEALPCSFRGPASARDCQNSRWWGYRQSTGFQKSSQKSLALIAAHCSGLLRSQAPILLALFRAFRAALFWALPAALFRPEVPGTFPAGQKYFARLEKKHGKGKALSILAAKLGRAVYYMLLRRRPFELQRFVAA
jgi:hypothetical protein